MFVVALEPAERGDAAIARLCGVLKLSRLEARARVQAAESSAAVVGRYADSATAEARAAELRDEGLDCFVCAPAATAERERQVTSFALDAQAIVLPAEAGAGEALSLPYGEVRLLLRASRMLLSSMVEVVRERKLSLPRAIITGGLIMTRVEKRTRQVTRGESESLLFLYSSRARTLCFAERALDFRGLGERLSPQTAENFERLSTELRRRCPQAGFDDRLGNRVFQAAVLGPALAPERHLDLALTLLRRAHQRRG